MTTQSPLRQAYEQAQKSGKFETKRLERALKLAQDAMTQINITAGWVEIASTSEGWRRISTNGGLIGSCDCPDCKNNRHANNGWCAHRIGVALIVKAREIRTQELAEVEKTLRRERKEKAYHAANEMGYEAWL